jgi:hypothetical protein
MKVVMYVKNLGTKKTYYYVDTDLDIVTKHNPINFTLLSLYLTSRPPPKLMLKYSLPNLKSKYHSNAALPTLISKFRSCAVKPLLKYSLLLIINPPPNTLPSLFP